MGEREKEREKEREREREVTHLGTVQHGDAALGRITFGLLGKENHRANEALRDGVVVKVGEEVLGELKDHVEDDARVR